MDKEGKKLIEAVENRGARDALRKLARMLLDEYLEDTEIEECGCELLPEDKQEINPFSGESKMYEKRCGYHKGKQQGFAFSYKLIREYSQDPQKLDDRKNRTNTGFLNAHD